MKTVIVILSCLLAPLAILSQEPPSVIPQYEILTPDQAIAAVRSEVLKSGDSFEIIRELTASTDSREVAQRSLEETFSHHVSVERDGVLLGL